MPLAPPNAALARPELAEPLALLRALEAFVAEAGVTLPPEVPHLAAAEARLAAGVPALAGEPLLDADGLAAALTALDGALAVPAGAEALRVLAALRLHAPGLDADRVLGPALAGDSESLELALDTLGPDAGAAAVLIDWAVRPALRAGAARVADLVRRAPWSRGSCPGCGTPALLGELRPSDGGAPERYLRCGRCSSAWSAPRVRCIHCGEHRHDRLNYLSGEGERESRRVETCEHCRGYVKTVAVLSPLTPLALAEADLATAGLDFVALERGYLRTPHIEALSPEHLPT